MSRLAPLLLLLASPACSPCAPEPTPPAAAPRVVIPAVALHNLRAIRASRQIAELRAAEAAAADGGIRAKPVPLPVPAHALRLAGSRGAK